MRNGDAKMPLGGARIEPSRLGQGSPKPVEGFFDLGVDGLRDLGRCDALADADGEIIPAGIAQAPESVADRGLAYTNRR